MDTSNCKECGKPLPPDSHHKRRYCGAECRRRNENSRRRSNVPRSQPHPVKLEFAEACKLRLPGILDWFDSKLEDPETSDDTRLKVIQMLLDRGLGRPRQETEARIEVSKAPDVFHWLGEDGDQALPQG